MLPKAHHSILLPLLVCSTSAAVLPRQDAPPENTMEFPGGLSIRNGRAVETCQRDMTREEWTSGHYYDLMQDLLYAGPSNGDQFGDAGWNLSQIVSLNPFVEPELRWRRADRSAVEVIRSWATRVDEFQCSDTNFNAGCNSLDLGSQENCQNVEDNEAANFPQAVGMLKNIANFANALTDTTGTLETIRETVKTNGQEIHSRFHFSPDPNTQSAAGPLGHSAGYVIASSVAGLIPGIGALIGLPLGVLIGANSAFTTEAFEPQFERQMEWEGFVDETVENMVETIRRGLQLTLNEAPNIEGEDEIRNWIDGPGSLREILRNGDYADADSQAIGDSGRENLEKTLYSFAINREYKASNMFVVRVGRDQAANMGFDENRLCEEEDDNVPLNVVHKYCEPDGSILVVMRFNWMMEKTGAVGIDFLGEYGIDIRDIARNSWAWQQVNGFGDGTDNWQQNSATALEIGVQGEEASRLQHWTLPVCDIGTWPFPEGRSITPDSPACDGWNRSRCALVLNSICRCTKMGGWPYGRAPWPPMPVLSPFHDGEVPFVTRSANIWINVCAEALGEDRENIQGEQRDPDEP